MYNNNKKSLIALPIGTTIYFFWNGKERYLRKIRPTERYPYYWYSMEFGTSIPDEKIPSDWRVMQFYGLANNNAQRDVHRRDKYCARYQY